MSTPGNGSAIAHRGSSSSKKTPDPKAVLLDPKSLEKKSKKGGGGGSRTPSARSSAASDRSKISLKDIAVDTSRPPKADAGQLCEGSLVCVYGLQTRTEYNGYIGTLLRQDENSGRWEVVMEDGTGLLLTSANFRFVSKKDPITKASMQDDKLQGLIEEAITESQRELLSTVKTKLEEIYMDVEYHVKSQEERRKRTLAGESSDDGDFMDDDEQCPMAKATSAAEAKQRLQAKKAKCSDTLNGKAKQSSVTCGLVLKGHKGTSRRTDYTGAVGADNMLPASDSPGKALFADANDMKDRVRAALSKKPYNVCDFYYDTGVPQMIARSNAFENTTLVVIALNALWIAIDTDNNDADVLIQADPIFQVGENLFCAYFFFEWLMRFLSFKVKRDGLKDGWFVFDSVLVLFMVMETWVMTLTLHFAGTRAAGARDASLLRLFRLLRLTRMARMVRLLRSVPELMILIKAIVVAFRSVFFTICLLMIIIYVFAIAFVQLTENTKVGKTWFNGVLPAMSNLLLAGNLPDHAPMVQEVAEGGWHWGVIIMAFIFLAPLTVMGMLAGVLVEVVSVVSAVERESMVVQYVSEELRKLLSLSDDQDGTTRISRGDFQEVLLRPDAARMLTSVGIDVIGLAEFCDFLFKDSEEITFSSFMELVLQLRGTNGATVKDMVDMRKFFRQEITDTILSAMMDLEDVIVRVERAVINTPERQCDLMRKQNLGQGMQKHQLTDVMKMIMARGGSPFGKAPEKPPETEKEKATMEAAQAQGMTANMGRMLSQKAKLAKEKVAATTEESKEAKLVQVPKHAKGTQTEVKGVDAPAQTKISGNIKPMKAQQEAETQTVELRPPSEDEAPVTNAKVPKGKEDLLELYTPEHLERQEQDKAKYQAKRKEKLQEFQAEGGKVNIASDGVSVKDPIESRKDKSDKKLAVKKKAKKNEGTAEGNEAVANETGNDGGEAEPSAAA
eukprot:TRINITY_DN3717_c0_g1_i1.p1 TRINITY_DN3717_c0_g1~~TRINITY_DN3717_c0_g1_i1.p1  ORF type:complete len:958 (-),score=250.10 TRINITY_DN3717_c0_g1_i1:172-3045(-)